MIAEWGPRGRRPRRARPVSDELTGNAIYDGTDDDGPALALLACLAAAFAVILVGLALL